MNEHQARLLLAQKNSLDALHVKFLGIVGSENVQASEFGSLEVSDGFIRLNCLGYEVIGVRRIVATDGRFYANEYEFKTAPCLGSHRVCSLFVDEESMILTSLDPRELLPVGYRRPNDFSQTVVPLRHAVLWHVTVQLPYSAAFAFRSK